MDPVVPAALVEALDSVASEAAGKSDLRGAALAEEVAHLSAIYTRERDDIASLPKATTSLAARLRFFVPRDLPKILGPLSELASVQALPPGPAWRVLDLGAGEGTMTLGVALFAARTGAASSIDAVAVDRDARALSAMRAIAARAEGAGLAPIAVETRVGDLRRADPAALGGPFDLVTIGLALNEIESDAAERAALLVRLSEHLAPGGAIVVIEPALRATARALHAVRDVLVARGAPPHVFAPCLRGGACPMLASERDWCHEDVDMKLPARVAEIARAAGLRESRLTYAYLTLRRDRRSLRDLDASGLGELYRVVSAPLASKGKLEVLACGEPGRPRLARLDRHRSEANAALDAARRGVVLRVVAGAPERERIRIGADEIVEALSPRHIPSHIDTDAD